MTVEQWLGEDNQIGIDIWKRKYQYQNETFEEWLNRASGGNAKIADLIIQRKLLFGGRVLSNRGTNTSGSLSNCYSEGYVPDDYAGIMDVAKDIGLTFKGQGGQGISLSKLRPKGAPIGNDYTSDGIVPFMKIFNEVTSSTSQGGARKGALMISLDARHKEAETFITIKSGLGLIEKANLSLEVDDEFMDAVRKYYESGEVVVLHEKRKYGSHTVMYDVTPINIFKLMVDNCYDWADPACLYVNEFRNYNLMEFDDDYTIENCNPCGEQPLMPFASCNLSSMNLSEYVLNPYTEFAEFDMGNFLTDLPFVVVAMDDILDENADRHPLPKHKEVSLKYRNIGIGVLGYAGMLMKLGMEYGSDDAIEFTDRLFNAMFKTAVMASANLANKRGSFPGYKECVWDSRIIKNHFTPEDIAELKLYGLRNCSLLSIAPTGSIATMLGESGGCEPEFAIKYTRKTIGLNNEEEKFYDIYCKSANEYRTIHNTDILPDYFVGSKDIPWRNRVLTQAKMQKHIDTAISSTVNLPNDATKEEIAQLYLLAWANKLKGITIFRAGCKKEGILTVAAPKQPDSDQAPVMHDLQRGDILDASDCVVGKKRKLVTGCGSLHCLAYFDPADASLMEVYLSKGSTGGCQNYMVGLSRMISVAARAGVEINTIVDQLGSTGVCSSYAVRNATRHDTSKGSCCAMAVGNALLDMWNEMKSEIDADSDYLADETPTPKRATVTTAAESKCPECGERVIFEEGCVTCKACGFSKCS